LASKKAQEAGPAGESARGADAVSRHILLEEEEEEEEEKEELRGEEEKNPGEEGGGEGGQGNKEGEGSEEEVEWEEGEVLEGGEGADDDEYEKAAAPLSHTLCPVPYTSLSLSVSFRLPRSLRLTIREDLTFLRAREARPEPAKT
jgi:hypothetical protein